MNRILLRGLSSFDSAEKKCVYVSIWKLYTSSEILLQTIHLIVISIEIVVCVIDTKLCSLATPHLSHKCANK